MKQRDPYTPHTFNDDRNQGPWSKEIQFCFRAGLAKKGEEVEEEVAGL